MVNLLQPGSGSRLRMMVALVMISVAFAAVIAADYLTPYELNLSAFYLVVTLLVSWYCGLACGLLFACLCTFAQIAVGSLTGTAYSDAVYGYVAGANVFFAHLMTAVLTAGFRTR